ncbi:hypothetical protein [Jiella marina]|uniref:hypothetical protein n=1 Tax=Jiella sp. LLJ827 TaxID=2917712 RepID=UPI002100E116|nr:hypothetical protein [Jiella sp. LLJ827]MCQ0989179.1 hypothetical protein [Jiella sp. LLJ827]
MSVRATGPAALFLAVCLGVIGLLTLPLTVPVGPFYWDTLIYYDGAARVADGQIPSVDFMTPGGPLGYWLFYAILQVFPNAQGLYAASWMLLLITGPLMALVVYDVSRRSPLTALGLAAPFLFFSVLPFNVEQFYPYPGADGYGIYNRQPAQLLFVLLAALLFAEARAIRVICAAATLLALFLIKITGFLVALPLIALALLSGRLSWRMGTLVLVLVVLPLAGLELWSGVIGAYLHDIARLVAINGNSLTFSLLRGTSIHLGQIVPALLLAAALMVYERHRIFAALGALVRRTGWPSLAAGFDSHTAWIALSIAVGIVFESENWGGQAFIFLWPPVLRCLLDRDLQGGARQAVIAVLGAATVLPAVDNVAGRALRSFAADTRYVRMEAPELGPLAAVTQHPESFERAALIRELSVNFPEFYAHAADKGHLPNYIVYNEPDFQIAWLRAIGEGVSAIRAYEQRTGARFETILNLNFVNPFPYLLDRKGPKHVSIGADPFRTIPPPDARTVKALAETDLILWPRCFETIANRKIRQIYAAGLEGRRAVSLSPCWDGFIRGDATRDSVLPAGRSAAGPLAWSPERSR